METILILEWIFYLPSLENGNNILFWIIYYPKLYFLLILSWILQFPFFSSPGYISLPGLEFVLTLTGYFLINQTWGNCIFSKLGFFLKTRKYPGENQVKTGLDFSNFFLCRRFLLSFGSGMGSILSLWDSIPFFVMLIPHVIWLV